MKTKFMEGAESTELKLQNSEADASARTITEAYNLVYKAQTIVQNQKNAIVKVLGESHRQKLRNLFNELEEELSDTATKIRKG